MLTKHNFRGWLEIQIELTWTSNSIYNRIEPSYVAMGSYILVFYSIKLYKKVGEYYIGYVKLIKFHYGRQKNGSPTTQMKDAI